MYTVKSSLKLALATEALKLKFLQSQKEQAAFADLKARCMENLNKPNFLKIFLRIQKMDLNRIIVDTVLQDLSEEKRSFILRKYKKNEMLVHISMELNVSVSQLNKWDKEILGDICGLMFYSLSESDVFFRRKVINMIHVLDLRIQTIEGLPAFKQVVDPRWYESLLIYREKYTRLLCAINNCMTHRKESIYNDVVAERIENPLFDCEHIANRCHVSIAAVSRHLKNFTVYSKQFIA